MLATIKEILNHNDLPEDMTGKIVTYNVQMNFYHI